MADSELGIDRLPNQPMGTTDFYSKCLYRTIRIILTDEYHKLATSALGIKKVCALSTDSFMAIIIANILF